jgi:hypothetical protein
MLITDYAVVFGIEFLDFPLGMILSITLHSCTWCTAELLQLMLFRKLYISLVLKHNSAFLYMVYCLNCYS